MSAQAIVLDQVRKVYPGGVRAVSDVSVTIGEGEWVTFMGSSGSGKTTLLNLIDGLDKPTQGRVEVLGTDMARLAADEASTFRREHIGLVFQQFHLIPYLTALENVMLAQQYHSVVDRDQATEMLRLVGMLERADHVPSRLSGGEQQRVCIARALVNDPQIILADEPTGNLDEANEERVVAIIRSLHGQGKTLIVVTHDRSIGHEAQRTVLLRHGQVTCHPRDPQAKPSKGPAADQGKLLPS